MTDATLYLGSDLESFATLYGFSLYNTIFHVLSNSGILTYPYLRAIYKNWRMPYESQDSQNAAVTSKRRMLVSLIVLTICYVLAVIPSVETPVNVISYRSQCESAAYTNGSNQSEGLGNDINRSANTNINEKSSQKLPPIWSLIIQFTSGLTYSTVKSFQCFPDLVELDRQMRNVTIQDPILKNEYSQFANECYWPARKKYLDALRGSPYTKYVMEKREVYLDSHSGVASGEIPFLKHRDVDWRFIGSRFFYATPGFYNQSAHPPDCASSESGCSLQAKSPVPGWPVNNQRDRYKADEVNTVAGGKPYCGEWWYGENASGESGSYPSLRTRLLKAAESKEDEKNASTPWIERIVNKLLSLGDNLDKSQVEDIVIARFVAANPTNFLPAAGQKNFNDDESFVDSYSQVGKYAAVIGMAISGDAKQAMQALEDWYTKMYLIKRAAPIIQSLLLLFMYMMLPIYLVLSEFDIDYIILAGVYIMTTRLLTLLWDIVDYIDSELYSHLFPDKSIIGSILTLDSDRLMFEFATTSLVIIVPIALFSIIALSGQKIVSMSGALDGAVSSITGRISGVAKAAK